MQRNAWLVGGSQLLAVALGYCIAGWIGSSLAIPPGFVTGTFPSAGIAVAGTLMYGARGLGGVWLGSFALYVALPAAGSTDGRFPDPSLAAPVIALGAVAQAFVAAHLVRRRIGFPHALDTGRSVAEFLLWIGPVASVPHASCGSLILFALGAVPAHQLPHITLTWWACDALGAVVTVPILLTFLAEPRAIWRRRRVSVALPMLLTFLAALAACVRTGTLEQARIQQEFEQRALGLERLLSARIEAYLQVLDSLRAFYGASQYVDRQEFRSFVEGVLPRSSGLRTLVWVERVRPEERAAFEAQVQREIPHFRIRSLQEIAADGGGITRPRATAPPASLPESGPVRDLYPIQFLEPDIAHGRFFGADVGSEPRRRAALLLARDSGGPAATEGLEFFSSPYGGAGVLVALAVYRVGRPLATLEERRAALHGFSVAAFQLDEMVSAAIGEPDSRAISLRIDDVSVGARRRALYVEAIGLRHPLQLSHALNFGGRVWNFGFSSTPRYAIVQQAWGARELLTTTLFFCGVLGGFLLVLTGRAFELERASAESKQLLATLVQSSHDAIIAYDLGGVIVGWNDGAAQSFGWRESEVLGKSAELFVPPELRAEHLERLARAEQGDLQPSYETVRIDKFGQRREVSVKLSPIHGASGASRGASEICRDISQEKAKDRALRSSLREKEMLLKEVHHRVKNNLQIISSLLNLQASYLPTPELRGLFGESQARVQSIALVHEQLYRSKDLAHVDFEDYVRTLAAGVFQAQSRFGQSIGYRIQAGKLELNVDTSVPCGLIVNELMTNALKHAFPDGRAGQIEVRLSWLPDERLELSVKDDGVGLPPALDPRHTTTLGLELVFTFAEQLAAEVSVLRDAGTEFRFVFRPVS